MLRRRPFLGEFEPGEAVNLNRRRWIFRDRWLRVIAPAVICLAASACKSPAMYESAGPEPLPMAPVYDATSDSSLAGGEDQARGDLMRSDEATVLSSLAPAPVEGDRRAYKNKRAQIAEPAPEQPPAEVREAPTTEVEDPVEDHGREIIYTAGLQLGVYDLESALALVEALPERVGGWVHMRNQQQVVLRVPAAKLELVMAELAGLGIVEARTLQAQDVTAEYVDLESRIKVLRETQAQLFSLLGKAKTVEEALHVRKALDEVTMQLELALGRMRQLDDLISFSTLTVTLVERGPYNNTPTSNDPFRWVDQLGVEATEWR